MRKAPVLYKKNAAEELSFELFKNPTCEYRATPFWAWNCSLETGLLDREIDYMKEMGFGGFHMHSRTGMAVPYLTDEFFGKVHFCVEKARKNEMLAWLYDEDRWPSGAAGGLVTKNHKYRARHLVFTRNIISDAVPMAEAIEKGLPCLIGIYDIVLNEDGTLSDETKYYAPDSFNTDTVFKGRRWNAYMRSSGDDTWYNGQSYVDTLSKEAIDTFISITHDAYDREVGEDFGGIVPAIFTDEPQFTTKQTLDFPDQERDCALPWTYDIPETFYNKYGYDLREKLPELFWELPDGRISFTRYYYHDHVCDRFTNAFADNVGSWCDSHGLNFTGHMMEEHSLYAQTHALGEAMRSYRKFGLPGIDMLCNRVELITAKQTQSAVHQYGREGMLSELYGVTDWDFDFRGHKFQGDWQAALGVTIRVPHLFWVSMQGEAKRDYPAAIGYQSPWYKEYSYVENHFARVNTAMTRGKPVVKVAVVHPVESYWLHWGPRFQTMAVRDQMEKNCDNIINWLISGLVDFDFICESTLPDQLTGISDKLCVGKMSYNTVIVPECETLRSSTVDILNKFIDAGGRVIFLGKAPTLIDALPDADAKALYDRGIHATFDRNSVLDALEGDRIIDIRNGDGTRAQNLLYQLRRDGDSQWLFIAHLYQNQNVFISKSQFITLTVKGELYPELYDTLSGNICPVDYRHVGGNTVINRVLFSSDSLLIRFRDKKPDSAAVSEGTRPFKTEKVLKFRGKVQYSLSEPNVLLLDYAQYKWDDVEEYCETEEILRLDNKVRANIGQGPRVGHIVQPWVFPPEVPDHRLYLKFVINSEIDIEKPLLAIEKPEVCDIELNGEIIDCNITGYFTDESIKTVELTKIRKGENILLVSMPFGRQTHTEWCYILGDFGVRLEGTERTLIPSSDTIAFQSVTTQGLPYYGGNIKYDLPVELEKDSKLVVRSGAYKGGACVCYIDGTKVGMLTYEPYSVEIPNVSKGKHVITVEVLGHRFNCFGAVHNTNYENLWAGPDIWRTGGDHWCDEYRLKDLGLLTAPEIIVGE